MNQIRIKNSKGLSLAGDLQGKNKRKVIIMCHGFRSNRFSKGRFDRFSEAFSKAGFSVLRFDFSGCGDSENTPLSLKNEVDDLSAAIAFVKSQGFEEIALYGHSLGARVCLEAFQPEDITTMVLTGAGTGPVQYNWNEEFTDTQLNELAATGFLTQPVDHPNRDHILISKQMLDDFSECDQQLLLSRISCPVLIVHGELGEEAILMPITQQGMKWLSADSKLEVLQGAEHDFMTHLDEVEELALRWWKLHF